MTGALSGPAERLVTPEMHARRGLWQDDAVCPPIAESDVRQWAIAVYWPEKPPRLFWDAAYATATRWGGIVALEDFNPFAWPIESQVRHRVAEVNPAGLALDRFGIPVPHRGAVRPPDDWPPISGMNAGREDEFGLRMRPGDVIAARVRLADWSIASTRFGPTLFATTEIEWRNDGGDLVRLRRQSNMRYFVETTGAST